MMAENNTEDLKQIIEAVLFVSDDAISVSKLSEITNSKVKEVKKALGELGKELEDGERGIQLREVAGGYRLFTHPAYAPYIEKFIITSEFKRLTQAAIETLAIIAYKQPITKIDINKVRGVNSESVVQSLMDKGLIREVGKKDAPGYPFIYGTTDYFLETFGLKSIKELPALEEFAPKRESLPEENE